ncbi:MAG: quinohemoprotein ethanol dehydrogenase, partial [Arenicella sp.]
MSIRSILSLTLGLCGFAFCCTQTAYAVQVDGRAIANPVSEWLSYGRDYQEQRFSPLKQLDRENVAQLDLAWSFKFSTARGMEATPLVHDGIIYISTGWSHVYALDARTGEQLWHYDAKVDKAHLIKTCCGPVNRGVALWHSDAAKDKQAGTQFE